jgi:hypothetical protein
VMMAPPMATVIAVKMDVGREDVAA